MVLLALVYITAQGSIDVGAFYWLHFAMGSLLVRNRIGYDQKLNIGQQDTNSPQSVA